MSKYYHYTTWRGQEIMESGVIQPSKHYGRMADEQAWPKLVYLTKDPYWESSIQAANAFKEWIKGESNPETYVNQGIPCWKFEVSIEDPVVNLIHNHPLWWLMFEDATDLGSDTSLWHWTHNSCKVLKAYKWIDGDWVEQLKHLQDTE